MTDATASPTAPSTPGAPGRPLEEVMLAMDVVDTLRHREHLVARELSEEERDRQLIARLREIYTSQGIEVPDAILAEGVKALKEQRFVYKPPEPGLSVTLAKIYVRRHQWGKAVVGVLAALAIAWGAWHFLVTVPAERRAEALQQELTVVLPERLQALRQAVLSGTEVAEARETAESLYAEGERALAAGDAAKARDAVAALENLEMRLNQEYVLKIVSRPGETSGVWRIPDVNEEARNFYLIVEALDRDGQTLELPVTNEETGETETVSEWGVRVPESTFNAVRSDKEDDGIIQNDILGTKHRGALEPDYAMPVQGGAITEW